MDEICNKATVVEQNRKRKVKDWVGWDLNGKQEDGGLKRMHHLKWWS